MVYPLPVKPVPLVTVQAVDTEIVPLPVIDRVVGPTEIKLGTVNVGEPEKTIAPCVSVRFPVDVKLPVTVVVPEWLIVRAAIVLLFPLTVPVPFSVTVMPVYALTVPNTKPVSVKAVVPGLPVDPVKSKLPKYPAVVSVGTEEPDVRNKFGATTGAPVVPTVNVFVDTIAVLNPPVPDAVKLVAVAIDKASAAAAAVVK
jgi:hypothetical protein